MSGADQIARYLAVRAAVKMSGLDDTIHAVHTGTEHAAELRLSDLGAQAARVAQLEEALLALLAARTADQMGTALLKAQIAVMKPDVPSPAPLAAKIFTREG